MENKPLILSFYCIILFIALNNKAFGQATSAGNSNFPVTTSPLDYIGWTSGVGQPVEIRNYDTQPINFYTDNTNFSSPRALIDPNGLFGIGIGATTPAARLHVLQNIESQHLTGCAASC